jgi:hypothetical protein
MRAAIHHIQTASEELSKLGSELLTLEQRIQIAQRTLREVAETLSFEEQQQRAPVSRATPMPPYRLKGLPLKTNAELCARVQQLLRLETKKDAEVAIGAVIDALDQTLPNNLAAFSGSEGSRTAAFNVPLDICF